MTTRNIILIIVVLGIVGAILAIVNPFKKQESPFLSGDKGDQSQSGGGSEVGQKVADFELESFDGQKVRLSQFEDKPIFIDFWAAWCPFCLEEMAEIEKIHQEFKGKLVVLGIHRTETEDTTKGEEFAKGIGVTYPLLKDSTGQIYKTLTGGRNFMPYTLYLDREGKIVRIKAGPKTRDEMRGAVRGLVQ